MITKADVAKQAVALVVGAGISKIVKGTVKQNVTADKVTDQLVITAASYVLGLVVAEKCKEVTDARIDSITDWWATNVTKTKKKDSDV